MRKFWTVLAALATLSLTNCGYNAIQTLTSRSRRMVGSGQPVPAPRRFGAEPRQFREGVRTAGKDVLLGVTNARAKVGSIQGRRKC